MTQSGATAPYAPNEKMPQPSLVRVARSSKRESLPNDKTAQPISITLRVGRHDGPRLPTVLTLALGHEVEVFAMSCDAASGRTTLQIHTTRDELGLLMQVIMEMLPQAEFGYIQPLSFTAVH